MPKSKGQTFGLISRVLLKFYVFFLKTSHFQLSSLFQMVLSDFGHHQKLQTYRGQKLPILNLVIFVIFFIFGVEF
jgi:hypothetical protein